MTEQWKIISLYVMTFCPCFVFVVFTEQVGNDIKLYIYIYIYIAHAH